MVQRVPIEHILRFPITNISDYVVHLLEMNCQCLGILIN